MFEKNLTYLLLENGSEKILISEKNFDCLHNGQTLLLLTKQSHVDRVGVVRNYLPFVLEVKDNGKTFGLRATGIDVRVVVVKTYSTLV